ncbi:peptidoglycan-binding protein [Sporolactobacillus shoreicorticis]|uniref:Peptidoglycan-binding protein n=1 Tax=Sporolactobacillus shoreicorticis TaxID=1923877 RepID=A0ABW5RZQ9_9BACL|nr:peptidoglycan-binding protein [Sporolactobacillus shoreicorticis]MCO7125201.1 peptidoglycan-binding protein [Sporolactobacillus shoreicorticis]
MAKYSIHAGHNAFVPGAQGYIKEEVVDRMIKDATIKYLRADGQTVYDDTDDVGKTQNENLSAIVRNVNAHTDLTLAVSIHLNAGGGTGIEVYQYDSKTDAVATRVLNHICAITGLRSRGIKKNTSLYVLRNTKPQAILVECGFVDTKTDAEIVSAKTDVIGKAIAEGILNKTIIAENAPNQSAKSAPAKQDATSSKKSPLLQNKSTGSAVKKLQQDLIKAGYSIGKAGVDGIFGTATERAVRALQSDYKIAVDGIVGPDTRAALTKAVTRKAKSAASSGTAVVAYPGVLLRRGSQGKDVERVQRALSLAVDGIFGLKTEEAVKAYQKRHGLTVDGIVGMKTWNTLF